MVAEDGLLCVPRSKIGHGLSEDLVNSVAKFYDDDDVSRIMPGQRDYVSVVTDGVRQVKQKRLLTMSLRESYVHFLKTHKDVDLSFSSFAALRPKNCRLLSKSGSHNVCVCTIHENVHLILRSLNKNRILSDRKIYMEQLLCAANLRTDFCHLRMCTDCYDTSISETKILEYLEEKQIMEVTFEQWITTDRCNIEVKTLPSEEFAHFFIEKLDKLVYHDFIKNKQSEFIKTKKASLQDGEVVITCDFAENYTFVLQDEVQSYHWNNSQCTIHPFVVYFNDKGELNHLSFIIISDALRHDTVAVQLFISKLLEYLKSKITVKKAIFISDGAASQYKNKKKFVSLCGFKDKYNIDAEWHFFATSHGKGPCDGIGGTLKRMATRASLAKEHEHPITNARELYAWAKDLKTKMAYCFVSAEEYNEAEKEFDTIFKKAKPIPGTQKFHSFIPISNHQIAVKLFSSCNDEPKLFNVFK